MIMLTTEEDLYNILVKFGQEIEKERCSIPVTSISCIDKNIPTISGVYWIETTMPVEEMREAISNNIGKNKTIRKNPRKGTTFIEQRGQSLYVAYIGTEENINKRLKQHLFNKGSAKTGKLGCCVDGKRFKKYQWRVGYKQIDSFEIRYAIEAWWRLNIGWPKFCLK